MIFKTQILPNFKNIIRLNKNHGIIRQFEVHFNKHVKFFPEFSDKRAFPYLSCSTYNERLMVRVLAPLS